MADNTISKLQINQTTYDLGSSEEGYSITSLTGQEELSTIPSGVYLYDNRILHIKTYTDYSIIIDGEQIYSYGNKSGSTLFDALCYHPTIMMMVDTTGSPLLTFYNAAISEDQFSYKLTDLSDNNLITLGNLKEVVRGYDSDTYTSTIYDDILNSDLNPLCFFSGSQTRIITDYHAYSGSPYVATMYAFIGGEAGDPTLGFETELIQGRRSVRSLSLSIAPNGKISIKKDSDSSSIITGFSEPTSDTDAANKKYVDTQIASVKPSVQKIEDLTMSDADNTNWVDTSRDIVTDLYIGEDIIGNPQMCGTIKVPITNGPIEGGNDSLWLNVSASLSTIMNRFGYSGIWSVIFLGSNPYSNSYSIYKWNYGDTVIMQSGITGESFSPNTIYPYYVLTPIATVNHDIE